MVKEIVFKDNKELAKFITFILKHESYSYEYNGQQVVKYLEEFKLEVQE